MLLKFRIAKCSKGEIGIIMSDNREKVEYSDGSFGYAWTGYNLKTNGFWCSRNPEIIMEFEIDEFSSIPNILDKAKSLVHL